MAVFTFSGNVKHFTGVSLASQVAEIGFRLHEPSMVVAGSNAGTIIPTVERWITPNAEGAFSVAMESVTGMLNDAWYVLVVKWNDAAGTLMDFPFWQFRPGNSGGSIEDIVYTGGGQGGGPGANLSLVLISLSKPPQLKRGQLWWKTDPNNPTNPANTGQIWIGE